MLVRSRHGVLLLLHLNWANENVIIPFQCDICLFSSFLLFTSHVFISFLFYPIPLLVYIQPTTRPLHSPMHFFNSVILCRHYIYDYIIVPINMYWNACTTLFYSLFIYFYLYRFLSSLSSFPFYQQRSECCTHSKSQIMYSYRPVNFFPIFLHQLHGTSSPIETDAPIMMLYTFTRTARYTQIRIQKQNKIQ